MFLGEFLVVMEATLAADWITASKSCQVGNTTIKIQYKKIVFLWLRNQWFLTDLGSGRDAALAADWIMASKSLWGGCTGSRLDQEVAISRNPWRLH